MSRRRRTHRDKRTGVTWTRCEQSGKRRYVDNLDALSVAAHASRTGPQRAYECPACEGWHLTRSCA